MHKSLKAVVSGRVQGVWFRASTKQVADKLGISGYAKNLPSGDVEVLATGEAEQLEQLIEFLGQGPELAVVDELDWTFIERQTLTGFETL